MRQLERPRPSSQDPYSPQTSLASVSALPSRGQWLRRFSWGCVYGAIAIVAGSVGLGSALLMPNPFAPETHHLSPLENFSLRVAQGALPYTITRPVTVVLMGIDRVEGTEAGSPESFAGRSDTLLLVRLDPDVGGLNILSIPRDTQVEIPNYGFTKINHANWFGGPRLVQEVISTNFNNLPVDRYVRVDTGIFREIVDTIGGVEVNVPKAMEYVDQTQGLYINLQPGMQLLNGDKAEQFARFRHDEYGDIGRVQRQQILLQALRQKLASPSIIPKIPQLMTLVQSYVDTNLSTEELLAILGFALDLNGEQIRMVMLPGRASTPGEFLASYWLPDVEAQNRILAEQFNQPALFADANIQTLSDMLSRQPRIAIQNASGQPDQARQMADYLVRLGFADVYVVEDWSGVLTTTHFIAQRGDREAVVTLMNQLQFGEIEATSTGAIESDITLRLGQDSIQFLRQAQTQ